MSKNLFDLDLQYFAEGEDAGVEDVEVAEPQEDETSETETEETGETNDGDAEPPKQTDEENAHFAAMRRRAEKEAQARYDREMGSLNQQIAAMCNGITHPTTGQPITNVRDYVEALQIQQRQAAEKELEDKGIDASMIDRAIATNPTVLQAQAVLRQMQEQEAQNRLAQDLAEIQKYDPSIKSLTDAPNAKEIFEYAERAQIPFADAYKIINFGNAKQSGQEAGRQQAINQMRGKSHLPSASAGVSEQEDFIEVDPEIMRRMKEDGKTEKQIRELYRKTVRNGLKI